MIEKIKKILFSPLALVLIVAIPTFIVILKPGYFPMHDDIQAMRLLEIDKCIKDGQIPCRWVPDMGFGYGYPQFNYYAPLPYYIMEIFHLAGLGYLDSVKAGFVLSFLLSGVGMYLLGRSLWGRLGGIVSSSFYLYLPYRAVDAYVRGAVGELYGLAFLPFVFWAAREVLLGSKKSVLWLALSLAALLTSHNITGLIIIPFLLAWVIFLIYNEKLPDSPDYKKRIFNLGTGAIWGLMISSFFVLPAFFERDLVHIQTLTGGYFNYLTHFVGLRQLLFSSYWGYGVSEAGPWDEIMLGIGILHLGAAITVFAIAIVLKFRRQIPQISFWIVSGLVSAFMIHPRSIAIWKAFPFSSFIQFPWRFLLLSGFFFSVVSGAISLFFPRGGRKIPYLVAIFVALILFYSAMFKPARWINVGDPEKFSGESWQRQQTVSIFDYLPIGVREGPTAAAPESASVLSGEASVINWEKGTNWQMGKVKVEKKAKIELPIYYFPGWKVIANGSSQNFSYENELALITVELEPGEYDLAARFGGTPIRAAGNIITILGILAIPLYLRKK